MLLATPVAARAYLGRLYGPLAEEGPFLAALRALPRGCTLPVPDDEVDERQKSAQFILTGSANPEETAKMHSGAGRFTIVDMRTMSWKELGFSTGKVSLENLFEGHKIDIYDEPLQLDFIIEKIVIGGFPVLLDKTKNQAADLNRAYIELLAEVDMSRVSNTKRDPVKVRSLLRSLARNTATMVDISALEKDMFAQEKAGIGGQTRGQPKGCGRGDSTKPGIVVNGLRPTTWWARPCLRTIRPHRFTPPRRSLQGA
jgi:hypothetical protein